MSAATFGFVPFSARAKGVLIVFCDDGLKLGSATRKLLTPSRNLVARAAKAERFNGKSGTALDIVMPDGLSASRLIVIGAGKTGALAQQDLLKLGGAAMGRIPSHAREATIVAELPGAALKAEQTADLTLGARLRAYTFDRYKTKRKDNEDKPKSVKVEIAAADAAASR